MKRCQACRARAYYADVHCQRCSTVIAPPPPVWLQRIGAGFWVLVVLSLPLHVFTFLNQTEIGRAMLYGLPRVGRYLLANGGDIAGAVLAFIVAPLLGTYFVLRAMVDLGDWLDIKTQQWRAERFRKYGW